MALDQLQAYILLEDMELVSLSKVLKMLDARLQHLQRISNGDAEFLPSLCNLTDWENFFEMADEIC